MQEILGSPYGKGHWCPFHSLFDVKDSPVPGQNSDYVLTAFGPSAGEAGGSAEAVWQPQLL